MLPFLIPAIISAAGSVAQGVTGLIGQNSSNKANRSAVEEQNEGNMRLAEYQYSKNMEQWNAQNAYNTPAAQMQRYKDAGLNPNLVATQGTPGNAASSPQYEAPKLSAYTNYQSGLGKLGNIFPQALSLMSTMQEYQNAKYQGDVLQENARKAKEQADGIALDNLRKTADKDYFSSNAFLNNAILGNKSIASQYDKELVQQQWMYNSEANPLKLFNLGQQGKNLIATRDSIMTQIALNKLKETLTGSQNDLVKSQTKLNEQQSNMNLPNVIGAKSGIPKDAPWWIRMLLGIAGTE